MHTDGRMRARLVSPFSDELATKDVLVHLIVFVACRCMYRLLARIVSNVFINSWHVACRDEMLTDD